MSDTYLPGDTRRRAVHLSNNGKRRAYSCKHCFAQMVFCGDCGEFFRRVHWNNRGCKSGVTIEIKA